ncbi:BrnA antitoxin family protein [Vibrio alginolyticus]|uniref:BrnA antitoxin family protein n=1 Tax=Vibrio alginolyticus TaxID=663 RepID=UPI001EED7152|nr:BrnA antitoxin family protein [Vibrio alginolyticus]ULF83377.1 BrnA antitoxin family protein [Vibrio alginolyticus]
MSTQPKKIDGTIEAWENGQLGRDEQFVEKVTIEPSLVDDSLELQMISIRLQKGLLDDLKNIAKIRGIGYQPLIKQVLKRFADAEMKMILREMAAEEARKEQEAADESNELMKACG